MPRNFDYKELNRQCSDAGVHLDVATVQHSSDTPLETFFCTQIEESPRELIKTVATDRSRLSVRGSCLLRPSRVRAGMSVTTFTSPRQCSRVQLQLQVPGSAHDQIIHASSDSERFTLSTTAPARVRKSRPINKGRCAEGTTLFIFSFTTSNNNVSHYSDRRDQRATITECVSLSFTSFVDLVFQTMSISNFLYFAPVPTCNTEETSCVDDPQPRSDLDSPHPVLSITDRPISRDSDEDAGRTVPVTTRCMIGMIIYHNWCVFTDRKVVHIRVRSRANSVLAQNLNRKEKHRIVQLVQPS